MGQRPGFIATNSILQAESLPHNVAQSKGQKMRRYDAVKYSIASELAVAGKTRSWETVMTQPLSGLREMSDAILTLEYGHLSLPRVEAFPLSRIRIRVNPYWPLRLANSCATIHSCCRHQNAEMLIVSRSSETMAFVLDVFPAGR